jgi:4-hydroxybenzoate polyprenyltransferase
LFLWLFTWEIGGQNLPNDLMDLAEDRKIAAKTIPVHYGLSRAKELAWWSLVAAAVLSLLLFWASPAALNSFYPVGAAVGAALLLLIPGHRLYRAIGADQAGALFNKASYYPVMMLAVVLIGLIHP